MSEKLKKQSVIFQQTLSEIQDNDIRRKSKHDIEIALAPDVQSYMTQTGEKWQSCFNVRVPIAFERADTNFSWCSPKFDSPVLEEQFSNSVFPHMRMLYRFSLVYILICTLGWCLYFWIEKDWFVVSLLIILATVSIIALWFTNTYKYLIYRRLTSIITNIIVLCTIGLSFLCFYGNAFSPLGHFALCLEIIILIYSATSTEIWIRYLMAISYSILFETLSCVLPGMVGVHGTDPLYYNRVLIIRILLQFSVHLMVSHQLMMRTVRQRGTFMKMGRNLLVRRQLEMEKKLNENMIHSVMPPKIADMLLNEDGTQEIEEGAKYMRPRHLNQVDDDFKSLFRPFHIRSMNNVSILFSDIIGFTVWSSNKPADQVVEVLNDLFGKFDNLCSFSGCEKISILGDCYYCISGCPEPKPNHAVCCVEMGLGMIDVMRYYEAERLEGVKMRLGVHTGTVYFGIVGTRRVRFDVWSNDVDLAKLMEYTGKPEQVHITQATLNDLGDGYLVEEGEEVMGKRTFFVMGRKEKDSQKNIIRPSQNVLYPLIDNNNDDTLSPSASNVEIPQNSQNSPDSQRSRSQTQSPKHGFLAFMSFRPQNVRTDHSVNRRRDLGIESNSHRPSTLQIYALNQAALISQRRFSGDRTSSSIDLGVAQIQNRSFIITPVPGSPTQPVANLLEETHEQLKGQSDVQLTHCVRDSAKWTESNFLNPPLHPISLVFQSEEIEREFRSKTRRFAIENETQGPPTIATPRYSTYLNIFVGFVVYCCVATSLLLMAPHSVTHFNTWLVCFSVFTSIQLFALVYFTRQLCHFKDNTTKDSYGDRIFTAISSWYPWHICIAILMAMPVVLVIIHYFLLNLHMMQTYEYYYGFLIFVCIVQFCNFPQLKYWMRNILALLAAIGLILICYMQMIDHNQTFWKKINQMRISAAQRNVFKEVQWFKEYYLEIHLDLLFLLILVWMFNRELEIGYRLRFYGNAVAKHDKIRVLNIKNQLEVLLHNIMPKRVVEHLKNTAKYSENHRNIAIIFASIVNFDEFCDERYLAGKENLRVLNEIIGDFDEQLSRPEFKCVEKLKTIGSTFMAASGLNPHDRCVKNHHIVALMEFSKSMLLTINSFNKHLLEFELILRIGFNVGDVTAGVIGTSKLHYDIWGDAVNVASRMNTMGVQSRIQVGKNCLPYLKDWYEFESRGTIYVKGKGNMEVFLYKTNKPYSAENDCGNECGLQHLLNKRFCFCLETLAHATDSG